MKRTCVVVSVAFLALMVTPSASFGDALIVVTETTDEFNADGDCSLREAIRAANIDAPVDGCTGGTGSDEISIPAGTYVLDLGPAGDDDGLWGDLDINSSLVIRGTGARSTVLSGGAPTVPDRVLHVRDGTVHVTGVTVRGGVADSGGGIYVDIGSDSVTLSRIEIRDNTAGRFGGGLFAVSTVSISESAITHNKGGGTDALNDGGGGIFVGTGSLTATNVTLSGNETPSWGGAVRANGGSISLSWSTVSGNSSEGGAGGFYTQSATVTLRGVLVSGNTSPNEPEYGTCIGALSSDGYNLFDVADLGPSCGYSASTGDAFSAQSRLLPLSNYGGPTSAHALGVGSDAIDAASDTTCPATDQRGRLRPKDGLDPDQTPGCDVGSIEITARAHPRQVSLSLFRHIMAGGSVTVSDGFKRCRNGVHVLIQRKVAGSWRTVAKRTTSPDGSYRALVLDKVGTYRAKLPVLSFTSSIGDHHTCPTDVSPQRMHRH